MKTRRRVPSHRSSRARSEEIMLFDREGAFYLTGHGLTRRDKEEIRPPTPEEVAKVKKQLSFYRGVIRKLETWLIGATKS